MAGESVVNMQVQYCLWVDAQEEIHRIDDISVDFGVLHNIAPLVAYYESLVEKVGEQVSHMVLISEVYPVDTMGKSSPYPRVQLAHIYYPDKNENQIWVNGAPQAVWRNGVPLDDGPESIAATSIVPPGVLSLKYTLCEFSREKGRYLLYVFDHKGNRLHVQTTTRIGKKAFFAEMVKLETNRFWEISFTPYSPEVDFDETPIRDILTGHVSMRSRIYNFRNFSPESRQLFLNDRAFRNAISVLVKRSFSNLIYEMADIAYKRVAPYCKTPVWECDDSRPGRPLGLWDFLLDGIYSPDASPSELAALWDRSPEITADTIIGHKFFNEGDPSSSTPERVGPVEEIVNEVAHLISAELSSHSEEFQAWSSKLAPTMQKIDWSIGQSAAPIRSGSPDTDQVDPSDLYLPGDGLEQYLTSILSSSWYVQVDGQWKQFVQDEDHGFFGVLVSGQFTSIRVELMGEPWVTGNT